MKACVWLWPLFTIICASPFVCSYIQQQDYQSYADFPSDSNNLIQDYLAEKNKRTKPSLSIVNPIDVLRQRLLLEIARRQMKENTKQVELNRAYLKNIGKRGTGHKQLQQQLQQPYSDNSHQYAQVESKIPTLTVPMSSSTTVAEHHQHPGQQQQQQQRFQPKEQQNQQQQQQEHQNRNHLLVQSNLNNKLFDFWRQQQQQHEDGGNNFATNGGTGDGLGRPGLASTTLLVGDLKDNIGDMSDNEINENNNDDDDYQIRYLYRLHKNRFSRE